MNGHQASLSHSTYQNNNLKIVQLILFYFLINKQTNHQIIFLFF